MTRSLFDDPPSPASPTNQAFHGVLDRRMWATMLCGVKRRLLAMLAASPSVLRMRVGPVPPRAFDSAPTSWRSERVGTKGVPTRAKRGVRLACGASNKGQRYL
jgi:hypothetical protein